MNDMSLKVVRAMSVPMSLDHVSFDDYHDIETIPVNKKVVSFDYDDCAASLEKIKRNKALMCFDDGYASMDELSTRIPRKKGKLSSIHDAYAILADGCGTMDDLRRRIRKQKKVTSLDVVVVDDDDDDDNFEKVKTKIRKIASMDDVLTAKVTFIKKNETQNKISDDYLTLPRNEISDDDLTFPYICLWQLGNYLPAMAETFHNKDWSLLRKFCFSMDSENLSFEKAMNFELVATCIWFLLAKTSPLHVKVGVASALRSILSMATDMPTAQVEGVDHALKKTSIDQAYIDALVVEALCSRDGEIIRQVCWTIVFIGIYHRTDSVGTSIQNKLVKLACSFPLNIDASVVTYVLKAINGILCSFENGFMKKKLVETVHSDRQWLLEIMRDPDEDFAQEAYSILEFITRGKYDDVLWDALVVDIIPTTLKRFSDGGCDCLSIYQAEVVANAINGAASPDRIKKLVEDTECIGVLVCALDDKNERVINMCMEALEKILKAGDDESEDNEYAMRIGYDYGDFGGWDLLDNQAPNSDAILLTYAPRKWLLSQMRFKLILLNRGEDVFS